MGGVLFRSTSNIAKHYLRLLEAQKFIYNVNHLNDIRREESIYFFDLNVNHLVDMIKGGVAHEQSNLTYANNAKEIQ